MIPLTLALLAPLAWPPALQEVVRQGEHRHAASLPADPQQPASEVPS